MVGAVGPVFQGGFEVITSGEGSSKQAILFLPDKHNDDLQRVGKSPVYYWMPDYVRLARKGDTGDYKFHLIHFVGRRSADTTVGAVGDEEVTGGVFSLTTTMAFPAAVLERAQEELLQRFEGKDLRYWGWRTAAAPMFRPMPIIASHTSMTNLAPASDGSTPAATEDGPASPRARLARRNGSLRYDDATPRILVGRSLRGRSNLDPWYWHLQGQGPGSINPTSENAFSGLIGTLPAAIIWEGFHGTYSPIAVAQALKLKLWTQAMRLKMTGTWRRVFSHYSGQVKVGNLWWGADIKAEFNKLVATGGVVVELEIDGTRPDADEMRKEANKRIDQLYKIFWDQASKIIFEPAPQVPPAEAKKSGGLFGWGGSAAFKMRRDVADLELKVDQMINEQYIQDHVISSSLEGFYDEIKADPEAERKYFTTLYLDDWDRKVTRVFFPVVNWPDRTRKWVGDPVAFLSAQIGYPSTDGDLQWAGHVFQSTDTGDATTWESSVTKKKAEDVRNPPQGWTPDTTYVKRTIHFNEPPGESDSPYMRVFVEKNTVELDEGENGSPLNEINLEIRADSVGKLEVGPISLNLDLESSQQIVEVEFQALGQRADGTDRGITKFLWRNEDQQEPRYWEIFTGMPDYIPQYRYRVRVVVMGSIFTEGMEWSGDWVDVAGNGPLMVTVPTPDSPNVTTRRLDYREAATIVEVLPEATRVLGAPPRRPAVTDGASETAPVGAPPRTVPTTPGGEESPERGERVEGYVLASDGSRKTGRRGVMPSERTEPTGSKMTWLSDEEMAESFHCKNPD